MVSAVKNAAELLKMLMENKISFYCSRYSNTRIAPIAKYEFPAPEIPKKCWVIKARKRDAHFSKTNGKVKALLVFSSREKAVICFENSCTAKCRYKMILISRERLVKKFQDDYDYVIIDSDGLNEDPIIVPIDQTQI